MKSTGRIRINRPSPLSIRIETGRHPVRCDNVPLPKLIWIKSGIGIATDN